jgi:hypothetical protein
MRNKRIIVLLVSILFFMVLEAFAHQVMVVTDATTPIAGLYVDPQTSTSTITGDFAVNANILNVTNLYGWEITMTWNTTILDALEVNEGSFLKSRGNTFFTSITNNTEGYIIADCALLGSAVGTSGNGVLMTVEFYVKTSGQTTLDLNETMLLDPFEQPIEHTKTDGYFITITHDVAVTGIDTSPTTDKRHSQE